MVQHESGPRWRSPWDWSLRVRLAIILLVPGVLAVALGGLRIADRLAEAAELERVSQYAQAQDRVAALLTVVGQERFGATAFVVGDRADAANLRAAIDDVDAVAAGARPVLEDLVTDDDALVAPVRQAEQALTRLGDVRNLVFTSSAPASAVVVRYSELLTQLVELNSRLLLGVNATEVNGLATALSGLSAARNETSLQYALITAAGGGEPVAAAQLQSSDARLRTALAEFRSTLDAGQRVRYGALIAGAANTDRDRLVQGVLAGQGRADGEAARVFDTFSAEIDAGERGVRSELTATGADLRGSAFAVAAINAALLLVALLVGALIVGLIARALLSSLRTLRVKALDIAEHRLPEAIARIRTSEDAGDIDVQPIGVNTREEVGEVARAFDAVHSEAVRLAAQQALLRTNVNDMFVNLSRRSQSLVKQQLKLIDDMEGTEANPEQLGQLFQLDHLATRMRRNNENLLVLAGADLRQRRGRPVPAIDVLRASVSEIANYDRVSVRRAPSASVTGLVVNDLVHLVAELLDNATTYSPPDAGVVLSSALAPDGALTIDISDGGVGIDDDELAAVNAQLSEPPAVDVGVSRRMGLFVVGRLAKRHDITVRLARRESGHGTVASVVVPRTHLVDDAVSPATPNDRLAADRVAGTPAGDRGTDIGVDVPRQTTVAEAMDHKGMFDTPWKPVLPDRRAAPTPGSPPAPGGRGPGDGPGHEADQGTNGRPEPATPDPATPEPVTPEPVIRAGQPADREPVAGGHPAGNGRSGAAGPGRPVGSTPLPPAPLPAGAPDGRAAARARPPVYDPLTSALPPAAIDPDGADEPIFAEMMSSWFADRRALPATGRGRDAPRTATEVATHPARPSRPAAGTAVDEEARPAGTGASAPTTDREDDGWGSAADEGRLAVQAADESIEDRTPAGLPRRRPQARLVPGAVPSVPEAPGPRSARDPDQIRGRLRSYQRGLRDARENPAGPEPGEPPAEE